MHHAEQIIQAKRIFTMIDEGKTSMAEKLYQNPVDDYICENQALKEWEKLFLGRPIVLAASAQLTTPNSFLTHDLSGLPLLLTRDNQGIVHCFFNVCRHRGARVANGTGTAKRFVCPYHAWTFGNDGSLIARPDEGSFCSSTRDNFQLTELPVVERYGLIFGGLKADTILNVDAALDTLGPEIGSYELAKFEHFETYDAEWNLNWKLAIDTFLESYHFNVLHHESIHPIFYPNLGAFDGFDDNLRLFFIRRSIDEMRDLPEDEWKLLSHIAGVYVLFPNTVFVWQGEHAELWHAFPLGTDRCRLRVTMLVPKASSNARTAEHWNRNLKLLLRTVEEEDFPVGEGIQKSFRSGAQTSITFGQNEPALQHFHKAIKRTLEIKTVL